jgi:E3 ubiquitin-protein ligase MARCH6
MITALGSLRTGALTFQTPEMAVDPSLVYWSTTDRGLAILAGYIALAILAAIYVALDTPITSTPSGQRTEKIVRDSLRQAGGVLKVILIISIEMLAFPLYCGLLLDFAFLPLCPVDHSIATRWAFAVRAPATFCFVHWFFGTCYMFHFALFVGMCRKILRKGVLWFIRDPDDPTFHPVRDVLERNVTTQLRKIAFSALVYGALVILCLGGVIWSIGKMFRGIFPIHWISTEPVLEFPFDLMLYNFLTPLLLKLFKPLDAVHHMYAWWLRKCARGLRLSHFLFDDRRKDEEGRHVRRSWATFFTMKQGDIEYPVSSVDRRATAVDKTPEVYFKRDGKYVLTPCNDQYRPPKPARYFYTPTTRMCRLSTKRARSTITSPRSTSRHSSAFG